MGKKSYTKEQELIVCEKYPTMYTRDLAELVGLKYKTVQSIAEKNGIKKSEDYIITRTDSKLSVDDKKYIIENYGNMLAKDIAEILGKQPKDIMNFAQYNNLTHNDDFVYSQTFSKEELDYIRENYAYTDTLVMACKLGCDREQVWSAARTLGVTKADDFCLFREDGVLTNSQKQFIIENYETMSNNELSNILNVDKKYIRNYAHTKGIKKDVTKQEHTPFSYYLQESKKHKNPMCCVCKQQEDMIGDELLYKPKTGRYRVNQNYFQSINTEWKAYWLGFLYADGCVRDNGVSLALSSKDKEHLYKFKNSLQSDAPVKINKSKMGFESARILIANKTIANDLIKCGCTQRKSLTLKFPTNDIVSNDLLRHFIRGYFDGDGCIHINENKRTIGFSIVGTKNFLIGIKNIFQSYLGINNIRINKHGNVYELRVSGLKNLFEIYTYFYSNCNIFLDRKFIKFNILYWLD